MFFTKLNLIRSAMLILFFAPNGTLVVCQPLIRHIALHNEASDLFDAGKYEEAGIKFDEATELLTTHHGNFAKKNFYLNGAFTWVKSGNVDQAFRYLEKSVDKGYNDLVELNQDSIFTDLRKHHRWPALLDTIKIRTAKYGAVRRKLEDLRIKDQLFRSTTGCIIDNYGAESRELEIFKQLRDQQDSIYQVTARKIIDQYGWLDAKEIGYEASSGLWLVIQHGPLDLQKKILAEIKESVFAGDSPGQDYCMMKDRIEIREDRPQIFGSQLRENDDGTHTLYTVKDKETVNERRALFGMEPLEEYLKYFKMR